MIRKESKIKNMDNSGIKFCKILNIVGNSYDKDYATVGDIVTFAICRTRNLKSYIKNKIYKGIILTQIKKVSRLDGSYINFNKNSIIAISENFKIYGSRLYGPATKEVFKKNHKRDLTRLYLMAKKVY